MEGPDAGLGAHPLRHHGRGGRVHGGPALRHLPGAAPTRCSVVASLGAFTAIFAAAIAIAQDDIKRVLAYSTISQLGYMMLALGVGGYGGRAFPPHHARRVQDAAVPRRGERDPRAGHERHLEAWAGCAGGCPSRRSRSWSPCSPSPGSSRSRASGARTRSSQAALASGRTGAVRRGARHGVPHRVLHGARVLRRLHGPAARGAARARVTRRS